VPKEIKLTDREWDIMSILWREGSGTVAEVHEQLGENVVYTTVLWLLQTLEKKRIVRRKKEGRAHRYYPAIKSEDAGDSALNKIVNKVFQGSASLLVSQLVREHDLPAVELQRLRKLLDDRIAATRKRK
jgi:BlaI family transcriptional regulator, penicillinase repressor